MYLTYKIHQFLCRIFPRKIGYLAAGFVARIWFYLGKRFRSILIENLSVVLCDRSKKEIYQTAKRTYINFSKYIIDFLMHDKLLPKKLSEIVEVENLHKLKEAASFGKGVIILSCHMANWELGAVVVAKKGYKINAIAMPHASDGGTRFFDEQRNLFGIEVLSTDRLLRSCIKKLKEGQLLGILGDRDVTQAGEKVPFFGKVASMPKGAAFFSRKTGAMILPTTIVRKDDDTYKLIFDDYFTCPCTNDKKSDIIECIYKYIPTLEKHIRKNPDQWFVFDRIWRR